ncbi:transient receptor potential cation channel protein painless-like [Armigeres subalbatus]|uniref:transient receptor potential cation channel protein painless-like n=1 Tax=Armigeres subalbatus TaxID=124917 RepID=UPI002ED66C3C
MLKRNKMAQGHTANFDVETAATTLMIPPHTPNPISRNDKRLQRNKLQISLNNELLVIFNALEKKIDPKDGLSKMKTLLEDCRWATLSNLTEEMKNWDALTTIPEPKSFLILSKMQPTFGKFLGRNILYQPYLECLIERFKACNERIAPGLNAPLHYAVESLNSDFLGWLLSQPSIDVNIRNKQSKTALFLLCERYEKQLKGSPIEAETLEKIRRCILLLLDNKADFNVCSDRLKLPFEYLLNSSNVNKTFLEECVARFKGAIAVGKSGDAKQLCLGFYQDWVPVNVTVQLLEIMLRFKDEQRFDREFQHFKVDESNVQDVIRLLLHIAVELDMERTVKKIVEHGQLIFKIVKPVVSKKRDMRVCEPDQEQDAKTPKLVYRVELKGLLKKACEHGNAATLSLLLSHIADRELVNDDPILVFTLNRAQDLWKRDEKQIRVLQCAELLAKDHKIHVTRKDNNGNTALHTSLKFGFNDIALVIMQQKYAFLGARNKDNQTPLDFAQFDFWKMYFDQCVTVDVQRSYIDRNTIRFNLNGFDPYIFKKRQTKKQSDKSFITETSPVEIIAKSKELNRLLLHPVVYSFILVKWQRLTKGIYLNLICTLATAIFFGMHSLDTCNSDNHSSTILKVFTWFGAVYMIGRETVQILFLRINYFSSFGNYVDIATIFFMIIVLQDGCRSILSSLIVIGFALQLTVLIGALPFNTLSTYMHMFKTVSVNFVKSFLLFIPLLGAFTYSFFLSYNDRTIPRNATEDEDPFHTFSSFSNAALKTLVMTTGEYDAADVDFSGGRIVIFILFIFFAPIVVLNLINGLAVSDIASIKEESELISLRKKVLILERYERGQRNMPIKFIRRMFPTSFFDNYSTVIVVKPKELRKILVQQKNPPVKNLPQGGQNPPKRVWCVVPIMPAGWLFDGSEDFLVNRKFLKFPLFCTLDKHVMDEARRIVDANIMRRKMMDSKQVEITFPKSSFTELNDKLDKMTTEITAMKSLQLKMVQRENFPRAAH